MVRGSNYPGISAPVLEEHMGPHDYDCKKLDGEHNTTKPYVLGEYMNNAVDDSAEDKDPSQKNLE